MFVNEHMEKMQMEVSIKTVQMNDASEKKGKTNMVKFEVTSEREIKLLLSFRNQPRWMMNNTTLVSVSAKSCRIAPPTLKTHWTKFYFIASWAPFLYFNIFDFGLNTLFTLFSINLVSSDQNHFKWKFYYLTFKKRLVFIAKNSWWITIRCYSSPQSACVCVRSSTIMAAWLFRFLC